MKTQIKITCPSCGKERLMALGDFNRGRRKTTKCLSCYNRSRIGSGHKSSPCLGLGQRRNVVHEGYVLVFQPKHPRANNKGYVKRAVLVLEKQLGRFLSHEDTVHHINGVKDDDHLENLQILTNSEHVRIHAKQRNLRRSLIGQFV